VSSISIKLSVWGGRLHLWYLAHVGDLKKQCETVLGVVSQCCLTKHVFKMSKQYLANVALKINVKVCSPGMGPS
jgi:hypothetical protein